MIDHKCTMAQTRLIRTAETGNLGLIEPPKLETWFYSYHNPLRSAIVALHSVHSQVRGAFADRDGAAHISKLACQPVRPLFNQQHSVGARCSDSVARRRPHIGGRSEIPRLQMQ